MKKVLLTLAVLGITGTAFAGTPTIDGTFDGTGVWGTAIATDPGGDGWSGVADATNLYVTDDATYVYLGADCVNGSWQSWGFAINTTSGGGNTQEPWSRQIDFNYPNAPDYVVRGNCDNGWRELRTWSGSDWNTGSGSDLGSSESNTSSGFIEVRIPKASLGNPTTIDVAFFITGDQNAHGCFDQIPSGTGDTTADQWNESPSNVLNGQASGLSVPVELSKFVID